MEFKDLSKESQARLRKPRSELMKAEKKVRKELFHSTGWVTHGGQVHQWKPKGKVQQVGR